MPAEWLQKKVFLHFQGAMQTTRLWVNGNHVGEYAVSGYDSFHFDITPHLKAGANVVALTADEETGNANGVGWLLARHRDLLDVAYCLNLDGGGGQMENGKRLRVKFTLAK